MAIFLRFTFIFALVLSAGLSRAQDVACSRLRQCSPNLKEYELAAHQCAIEMKAFSCQAAVPAMRLRLRKCTPEAMCQEQANRFKYSTVIPGCTGLTPEKIKSFWGDVGACAENWQCMKQVPLETAKNLGRMGYGTVASLFNFGKEAAGIVAHPVQAKRQNDADRAVIHRAWVCYDDLYRYEIACQLAGGTFSRAAAAAALGKAAVTALSAKEAAGVSAVSRTTIQAERRGFKEIVSKDATRSRIRQEFVDSYEARSPVDAVANQKWIEIAKASEKGGGAVFYDVENAAIKNLNDRVLKDKSLVTAITNFHKQQMMRVLRELRARNPGLEVYPYSDFKSLRYAFKGKIPANLKQQLDREFARANGQFADELKRLKVVRDADDPAAWFKAGYGETADQATVAARLAREMPAKVGEPVVSFNAPATQAVVASHVESAMVSRAALESNPRMAAVLDGSSGAKTPSREVFELARKASSPQDLAEKIQKRFNLKSFSASDAEAMQSYISSVDRFSAGLHIAQRTVVNLDKAEAGGFSADLLGVGAANQKDLAVAMARAHSSEDLLKIARESERRMTDTIQARLNAFKRIVGPIAKCSGDDCVGLPSSAMSAAEKQELLNKLAEEPLTREVRMSFVGPNIAKVADRTLLATSGEAIEKALRASLEGKLPPERLQNITFAIDLDATAVGSGQVGWMAGVNGPALSSVEKAAIDEALRKALAKVNANGSKYTLSP